MRCIGAVGTACVIFAVSGWNIMQLSQGGKAVADRFRLAGKLVIRCRGQFVGRPGHQFKAVRANLLVALFDG